MATFTTLLGIPDAAALDVASLWAPRTRDDELRVPIGVTATGEPLFFDLKDEAEGGMGPHGLMIGMTGSGKSQTLMSILLSLLTTHSAERLIVIYADFKGEAGADIFRNFPQVVAVISNMAEKRSLADRFADTLRGEVARREQLLMEAGRRVQGSAFNSVLEYEAAIAAGHDLPPMPTLLVVADEFSLMLADHPEYADLFDYVARKGRSFRIHILFASQTLDVGRIKDIDKNTSYRIGLKVASPAVSRQIIGVEDAFHIEAGPGAQGRGLPGARPRRDADQVPQHLRRRHLRPATRREVGCRAIGSGAAAVHRRRMWRPQPTPSTVDRTGGPSRTGRRASSSPPSATSWPITARRRRDCGCRRWTSRFRWTSCWRAPDVAERQWRWPLGEIDRPFDDAPRPAGLRRDVRGGQRAHPRRAEVG